jgi:hypothetical protein
MNAIMSDTMLLQYESKLVMATAEGIWREDVLLEFEEACPGSQKVLSSYLSMACGDYVHVY